MKRYLLYLASLPLRLKGYSGWGANQLLSGVYNDLFHQHGVTLSSKVWAWKRGFFVKSVDRYCLNENNYKEYLSDFSYLKMHPLNGRYSHWIDDKLTSWYILSEFKENLPDYYFLIEDNSSILKLPDCPENCSADAEGILTLLEEKKSIAVKLYSGSLGVGFYHLQYENEKYFANKIEQSREEILNILRSLKRYLVTEYITNHQSLQKIYPHALSTIRVLGLHDSGKEPVIAGGIIRFGTKLSGSVDNAGAGGVWCVFNPEDGFYSTPISGDKTIIPPVHPDTGEILEGYIPQWEMIVSLIKNVMSYIPSLSYLGFDVAVTEKSIKIIEINSHSDIYIYQNRDGGTPLLVNPRTKDFYLSRMR